MYPRPMRPSIALVTDHGCLGQRCAVAGHQFGIARSRKQVYGDTFNGKQNFELLSLYFSYNTLSYKELPSLIRMKFTVAIAS